MGADTRTGDVARALVQAGTATVSDALDRLGLPGGALGIAPLTLGRPMAGPAFTVRYVPVGDTHGTVGDYIDDVQPGQVVVLDNGGRMDCTVWGDILSTVAHSKGLAGTAIHGVCRDVAIPIELGYPIYSRGRFMRTGKDRVELAEIGGTVSLGSVRVASGDVVIGDDDGLVVVPRQRAQQVAETALRITETEERIMSSVRDGLTLAEARKLHGYHLLQRNEEGS